MFINNTFGYSQICRNVFDHWKNITFHQENNLNTISEDRKTNYKLKEMFDHWKNITNNKEDQELDILINNFENQCQIKKNVDPYIVIQKNWRGFQIRYTLKTIQDSMTPDLLVQCINSYNSVIQSEIQINKHLKHKKIRTSNFPSHISENIVKFLYCKKYNVMPTWDTKVGDLCINNDYCKPLKIEVKGSINLFNGPPTFGPKESWDIIYFVDGKDTFKKKYKIYEIKLSNISETWRNMKVNKNQTYQDQCLQNRRPRSTFKNILDQIGCNNYSLVFDGHITELF